LINSDSSYAAVGLACWFGLPVQRCSSQMGRAVHAGINEIGLALDSVAGIVLEDAGLGLKELCEKNGPVKPCFAVTALVMRPFLKTNCQPLC
jgi:hypothetical protein